jgi:hypothetical protein
MNAAGTGLLDVLIALDEAGIEPVRVKGMLFYFDIGRMTDELWDLVEAAGPQLLRHLPDRTPRDLEFDGDPPRRPPK